MDAEFHDQWTYGYGAHLQSQSGQPKERLADGARSDGCPQTLGLFTDLRGLLPLDREPRDTHGRANTLSGKRLK
jgi:hypothetical protein